MRFRVDDSACPRRSFATRISSPYRIGFERILRRGVIDPAPCQAVAFSSFETMQAQEKQAAGSGTSGQTPSSARPRRRLRLSFPPSWRTRSSRTGCDAPLVFDERQTFLIRVRMTQINVDTW
jgi:hypothetical protein